MTTEPVDVDEIVEETKEMFERIIDNITSDFNHYIEQSKLSSQEDLEQYAQLSMKARKHNVVCAIMARTAAMYKIDIVQWVQELLTHNSGYEHKIEIYRAEKPISEDK